MVVEKGDREASYRHCYKPFLEDGFYFLNYSVKETEHKCELICKTFDRKSLLFSFSADTFCSLRNSYHTENINSPSFYCMLWLLLWYRSFTGWGCAWSCKWQLLAWPPSLQVLMSVSGLPDEGESKCQCPAQRDSGVTAWSTFSLWRSNSQAADAKQWWFFRLSPEHRVL